MWSIRWCIHVNTYTTADIFNTVVQMLSVILNKLDLLIQSVFEKIEDKDTYEIYSNMLYCCSSKYVNRNQENSKKCVFLGGEIDMPKRYKNSFLFFNTTVKMCAYLDKPLTDKRNDSRDFEAEKLYVEASTMQGWRRQMEDTHIPGERVMITGADGTLDSIGLLVAVFDGHGGDMASIYSQEHFLSMFTKCLNTGKFDTSNSISLGEALNQTFLLLDSEMAKLPKMKSGEDHSGTTAIVGLITATHCIVANAGDSRGILSTNQTVIPMSFDHKPTDEIETARIENAGGFVSSRRVNGDLALSRALGDYSYKNRQDLDATKQQVIAKPDIKIHTRQSEDEFLLLCCDGIWDVMDNETSGQFMREQLACLQDSEQTCCSNLLDTCLEKGSHDNMSAVVVIMPGCCETRTETAVPYHALPTPPTST